MRDREKWPDIVVMAKTRLKLLENNIASKRSENNLNTHKYNNFIIFNKITQSVPI